MINSLIEKLQTGSIKTVLLFGDTDKFPKPPYVVVKPETGVGEGTRQFRIIVHHQIGKGDILSDYIFKELTELLIYNEGNGGKVFISDAGKFWRLQSAGYNDVMMDTSENTIFMERIFVMPFRSGGSI